MNGERFIFPSFRRDPITDEIISKYMTEETIIHPYSPIVIASQIIDEFYRMKVVDRSGFYILDDYLIEVFNKEDIEDLGHFYCDYTNKTIYFHPSTVTESIRLEYYGCGDIKISSNSIVTQTDLAGDIVQTLDDILNSGNAGNLNESWGRATYIQPSNNILQLTKNRRQYVTNDTLLTGTTVKLPTMELGDYLQLTLMFYADSNLSLVFEDENIKFSNQPFIQAGRSYTFSFEYVDGTWYCEWVKLERYLKDYIYKAGDICVALTGGYGYSLSASSITNEGGKLSFKAPISPYYTGNATATTIKNIDLTNYNKLYIEYDYYTPNSQTALFQIGGVSVVTLTTNTSRRIITIDISAIVGEKNIAYKCFGLTYSPSTLNIYNAWLEKNEFVDTSQEIFTTSEKNKLIGISANANKVIDSTTNGNILIDGVETNIYTHPTGTNPHGTTKTDIELGNVDNTSDLNKPISTATQIALNLKINTSQKGVANGVAQLDDNGIIPSSQLPSYVDDVLEYTSNSLFPTTGESGKIYLNTTNNLTYRWTGSGYAEISPSIALGETSSTAYAGDKGKTTTDNVNGHIANTSNPHNVTKSQLGLGNVDNVSTNNQTPTYTVVGTNTTLTSGEILSTAFGKIAKAISSLITHLADTVSHITSTERTKWNSASTNNHTHTNKTVLDNTTAPYTTAEQTKLSGIANNANNYTLPVASTVIGGVKGGTDITVDATGNVSVVDDSHNHIIGNVDGLQTALDSKIDDSQVLTNVPVNAVFTDTVYTHPTNHTPSIIIQDSSNRFVTDVEKATWNGKATTSVATTSVNGLMSSDDKVKLDGISTVTSSEVTSWFNTL